LYCVGKPLCSHTRDTKKKEREEDSSYEPLKKKDKARLPLKKKGFRVGNRKGSSWLASAASGILPSQTGFGRAFRKSSEALSSSFLCHVCLYRRKKIEDLKKKKSYGWP